MKLFLPILMFFVFSAPAMAKVEWSIIIYAATDEEDLAHHIDPIIEELLKMKLPKNTEFLIENDALSPKPVLRAIRRGSEPLITTLLPQEDSADPKVFSNFLSWAAENATGSKKLFLNMAGKGSFKTTVFQGDLEKTR
jgi:hypothetical protein